MKQKHKIKFIIVNLITFSRIIGSILLPIYYFNHGIKYMAILVGMLFLTDMIDGKLSRYWKVESFLGSFLDTIGDKLFAFVMLSILTYDYPVVLIIVLLELVIFIINTLAFKDNKNIQSSKLGKFKTTILDINVVILYIYCAKDTLVNIFPTNIINFLIKTEYSMEYILCGIVVGIQLVTILDYKKSSLKQTTYEKLNRKNLKSLKEILNILTDREFYIENKNNSLRKLLYKTN